MSSNGSAKKKGLSKPAMIFMRFLSLFAGIFILLVSLLLLLVDFSLGLFFAIVGIIFIFLSQRYAKQLKALKETVSSVPNNNQLLHPLNEESNQESVSVSVSESSEIVSIDNTSVSETPKIVPADDFSDSVEVSGSSKEIIEEPKLVSNHVSSKPDFLPVIDNEYVLSYSYTKVRCAFPDLSNIELWDFVTFIPEPDNPYDSGAIKIQNNDSKIGYVYRGKLQKMISDYAEKDYPVVGYIDSVDAQQFTFSIAFYKPISSFKTLTSALTKTTKKDCFDMSRQDNLSSVSEGDLLEISYDYDSETYLVTDDCGNELGELSKSFSAKLQSLETQTTFIAICNSIDYDDSLKIKCNVLIILKNK